MPGGHVLHKAMCYMSHAVICSRTLAVRSGGSVVQCNNIMLCVSLARVQYRSDFRNMGTVNSL